MQWYPPYVFSDPHWSLFTFENSTHYGAVWSKSRAACRSQLSFCHVGSRDPGHRAWWQPPLPTEPARRSTFCGGVFVVTSVSWVGWGREILTIPCVFPPGELSWSPQLGWVPLLFGFLLTLSKATYYAFQYAILLISMCTWVTTVGSL